MLRIRWMMHVWTVVSGHTLPTTSGRPLRPSQTTKKVSLTPRLRRSVSTLILRTKGRALTTGAGPQPRHVLLPGQAHPDRGVDRPVGDLAIADLDHDRVDEDRRIDLVQGSGGPGLHLLEDLVGDPADRLLRDRGSVDLLEVCSDLSGWSARGHRATARSRRPRRGVAGVPLDDHRLERPIAVAGDLDWSTLPVAWVSTVLALDPLRTLDEARSSGARFFSCPRCLGHLLVQRGLQDVPW